MINIFLIDDHPLILDSIESILIEDEMINVVGKSNNFHNEIISDINKLRTDIVVLDVSMPEKDAFEIAPILKQKLPEVKIIIYTMHSIFSYFKHFFLLKVEGYIVKSSRTADLIEGIKIVANGNIYYPDHVLEKIEMSEIDMELNQVQFTSFEKLLLENLNKNYSNLEIAQIMNCSLQEVLEARKKLLVKTNTNNTEDLLKRFFK